MVEIRNKDHDIFMKKYKLGNVINVGANNGTVRECTEIQTGKTWMVETIQKRETNEYEIMRFERDFEIQKNLDHSNLLRQHELIDTKEYLYVVKELCKAPNLFDYLVGSGNQTLPENEVADVMR